MALTVIKPSGIDTSGNYTVTGMNVSANASVANLSVTTSANLGAVGNVIITGGTNGYVLQTDGSGTLSWVAQSGGGSTSNISNGNSNVNIPSANGNINFSAVGNANIVVVTGTGANITGTINVTSNANVGNLGFGSGEITGTGNVTVGNANLGNLATANFFSGNGSLLTGITVSAGNTIVNGNSNVVVTANGNITLSSAGNANILIVTGTGVNIAGTLNATGNTTVGNLVSSGSGGNISNANVISANTFIASGNITANNINTTGSGGNIGNANVISANTFTASGNITAGNANLGNSVTANYFIGTFYGTANLATFATTANAVAGANVSGQVANALVAGTVYTNAQPNITSVGTLTSLIVTGNITAGNANLGNLVTANFFSGNGSLLTGITVSAGNTIVNGNSNVVVIANGNVTTSVAGNANVLVITGTGANIAGTLNATGNTTVGNLFSSGSGGNISNVNVISANTFTASGNITAGNANLGNAVIANFFIGTFYGTANSATTATTATTAGTVTTAAQPNITSVGTLTGLTVSGSGSFGANVNLNSFNITNLATPVASTDAATKQYVDDVAQGLNVHDAIAAATPDTLANVTTGTITYNNGASGVGANLTTTGTFNLIDGVNVQTSGTRILVKNEANAVLNGIYTWSNATVITRATDYNSVPEVEAGDFVFCTGGTLYDNTGWVQTSTVTAIGTAGNNIEFTQFSGAGTYYAGTGLTLTGSTFSVNASQTQITSVGTLGNLTVTGNATVGNLTTSGSGGTLSNINVVSANTFTASGNITAGNANLGNSVIANFFTGNGNGLSSIVGANVSGQVANALVAGTVYTNAQPNITSVGTLTSLSVTGNINSGNANLGNLATANFFSGNGSLLTGITVSAGNSIVNGNSNVSVIANGNVTTSVAGNANILIVTGTGANITGTANITGNLIAGNITAGTGSGGNITGGNVISANTFTASGNITAANANLGNSVTANYFIGNFFGTANSATTAGTVTTAAQPNITSVGTLTGLTSTGTANFTGASNVALGPIANVHITGGSNGQYLQTDGTGTLSWSTVSSGSTSNISNGNSNVNIPSANGNVNISAVGNTILVVTGTGVNVAGTLNATGNLTAGNITAGAGSGGNITGGNVISANTFTASGNITAGNASLGNAVTANFFIGTLYGTANLATFATTANAVAGANVSGQVANALVAGTVYTNAQPNITSVGTLSSLTVSGNGAFGNVNAGNLITANYTTAVITTGAQPNITSVGSLTGLTVSNATGIVDFTTTANVTLGAVANLHITGGTNAYVLSTDGAGNLSWVAQSGGGGGSSISNGNSNVNIATANGNITMSAVGNANIVTVTGTGVNVAGTLNTTGNVALSGANVSLGAVGNVKITGGTANYILNTDGAGNLSWVAPPASANVTVDNFTGNGVQTVFTLSTTPTSINQTSVNYNGATVLRTDYTLANANITFSSAPANGSYIEVTTINLTTSGGGGGASSAAAVGYSLIFGG